MTRLLVACNCELVFEIDDCTTRHHRLPVRLDDNGKRLVAQAAYEAGGHFSSIAKARVECAVAVIARDRKGGASGDEGSAHSDDLPVRADRNAQSNISFKPAMS